MANLVGIDVSSHNGTIDWLQVKNSGVQFAIIRVLGWDKTKDYYTIDTNFVANIEGALNAGIQVGAYMYSYAYTTDEMMEEINFVLPSLNPYKDLITFPVYIDYEDKLILSNTSSNDQRTEILRTGMDALQSNGYLAGFYTYHNFAQNYINTQQLLDEGYDFWEADYRASTTEPCSGASSWQYSSTGSVPGISGNVDMNVSTVNYDEFSQKITVYDVNTGAQVTGKMKDIVASIVANEVGGGLGLTGSDRKELYKTQAVAAHSWLLAQQASGVSVPSVGLSTPSSDILCAANQVMRFTVQYNGTTALTAYGSCAAPVTNSAANMGWGNYNYLISVESPYDSEISGAAKYYPKTTVIGLETMRKNIIKMVGEDVFSRYENDKSQWITNITTDSNGNITRAIVCGVSISGGKFFENCWGLYSTNLQSWQYNGNDTWTFTTVGNGHGVGMSQYGAAAYISKGQNWRWVLNHYYPGTVIAQ
jgi:SpoIID/LytB domain protein